MSPQEPLRTHRLCAAIALSLGALLSVAHAAPAVVPLSSLDGSNGFRLDGVAAGDFSGRDVSAVGDINGDGIDDLIIGAHYASPNAQSSGSSYVVFGRTTGDFAAAINLSTLDGSTGFRLDGVADGDLSGYSVSGAGDINGDGIDDLIVGAWRANTSMPDSGSSYVVFGRSSGGFAATINLSTLDGSTGFRLDGVAPFDYSGAAVSAAGDINGDGIDDLIIGAWGADPNGTWSGSSYVVFGRSSGGFAPSINLSTLDGSTGFRLDGLNYSGSGISVSAAGDINGDGIDDLIIGAPRANTNGIDSGGSYVVFGRSTTGFAPVMNLSGLDGSTGFRLDGADAGDLSGRAVSAAGDINGDGIGDLLVGAYHADGSRGSSYVVFGRSSGGFASTINLSTLDTSTGFRLDGIAAYDYSGRAVSAAGDVNGDGLDDLIIGADRANQIGITRAGSSYVVFGRSAGGFDAAINLSTLDGSIGFRLDGVATTDFSGFAVSAAGDINGDGIDDLIIGAFSANPNGASSGSSYVVFGKGPNEAPQLEPGSSAMIAGLEDVTESAGADLANLVDGAYLDADPFAGAALDINAPVSADGAWQFRLGDADPWTAIPTTGLSSSNALLLAPDARLRFVPAPEFFGAVVPLSLRLWDGTNAASYGFGTGQDISQDIGSPGGFSNDENRLPVAAEILPVNDAPTFAASNPPTVLEDASAQAVTNWAGSFNPGPTNESAQQVLGYFISGVTNPALFAIAPAVASNGTLTYTLAANANGSADFSVRVQDDGGTADNGVDTSDSQIFTVTVQAVNDPPQATYGSGSAHPVGTLGSQTISNFASSIAPGPLDESAQLVTFETTVVRDAVGIVSNVAIDPAGSLSYTLERVCPGGGDACADEEVINVGAAEIEVNAMDDGGTANGGNDRGPTHQFRILVGDNLIDLVIGIERTAPAGRNLDEGVAGAAPVAAYQITVANNGPTDAVGARVQMTRQIGLTDALWTCLAPSTCLPGNGSDKVDTRFDLAAGQTVALVEVSGTADATQTFVELWVRVSAPAGTTAVFTDDDKDVLIEPTGTTGVFKDGLEGNSNL